MREPTKRDLLDEIRRLKAENERLNRLVATQRPELAQLRAIEVELRDYLDNGAEAIVKAHEACEALLQGEDDLPSMEEIGGCASRGKQRVDEAVRSGE